MSEVGSLSQALALMLVTMHVVFRKPAKRGAKPEVLEPFNGTFEQAIDKALTKKKPVGGWPK